MSKVKFFEDKMLEAMPELYSQDGKGSKAVVHLVARIPDTNCVWLLTEYGKEEELFFGFCCLNDIQMAELGYVHKDELAELSLKYPVVLEEVSMTLKEAKKKYLTEKEED